MRKLLCAVALCASASSAAAQSGANVSTTGTLIPPASQQASIGAPVSAAIASAPLQVAAPVGSNAVLRTGVEVPLRLLEELTTKDKKLRVGQRVRLETSEPIQVQGLTVIPVGTPAQGEITDVRNKGMWGKSGRFYGRMLYLNLNGRQIRLSGTFDDKGHAGGALAGTVSAIVFLPAGFFMTGTSAHLSAGTAMTGYIDEDVPLSLPAVQQGAVLAVPAAPAPIAVPPPSAPAATVATPVVAKVGH